MSWSFDYQIGDDWETDPHPTDYELEVALPIIESANFDNGNHTGYTSFRAIAFLQTEYTELETGFVRFWIFDETDDTLRLVKQYQVTSNDIHRVGSAFSCEYTGLEPDKQYTIYVTQSKFVGDDELQTWPQPPADLNRWTDPIPEPVIELEDKSIDMLKFKAKFSDTNIIGEVGSKAEIQLFNNGLVDMKTSDYTANMRENYEIKDGGTTTTPVLELVEVSDSGAVSVLESYTNETHFDAWSSSLEIDIEAILNDSTVEDVTAGDTMRLTYFNDVENHEVQVYLILTFDPNVIPETSLQFNFLDIGQQYLAELVSLLGEEESAMVDIVDFTLSRITYFLNDGVNNPENPTTYDTDDIPVEPLPGSKTGHQFVSWHTSESLDSPLSIPPGIIGTGDYNLYAEWQVNDYTITFNTVGGETIESITEPFGTSIDLPTPEKSGYEFIGWYREEEYINIFDATTMPAEDVTIYAKWEEIFDMPIIEIKGVIPGKVVECHYKLSRHEEGNTGYIEFWTDIDIQPYDTVLIKHYGTHQFIVESVDKLQVDGGSFIYRITLKDTVHIFDAVFPPDRRFTKQGGVSVRYLLNIYQRTVSYALIYEYLDNVIYDTLLPEKEYTGVNLTTILRDVFKRINGIPRVQLRDGLPPLIYLEKFSAKTNNEPIEYSPERMQSRLDTVDYATEIMGKVKNSVVEDGRGIWFPSKKGGISPRTDDFRFDEANAAYIFNDKIWVILKAYISDGIAYIGEEGGPLIYEDLEVTKFVVTKDRWDFLNNPPSANPSYIGEVNQSNTIYYQIGGDRVEKLWATHPALLADRRHLLNLGRAAADDWAAENEWKIYNGDYQFTFDPGTAGTPPLAPESDPEINANMRFNYVSQRDIDYIVEKMMVNDKYKSTILSNQLSSLVELTKHNEGLGVLAERTGNFDNQFSESTTGMPYKLGEWTESGELVTTVKRTLSGKITHQDVELSDNFANVDVETSVSREPYPFQITTKNVQTNIITKEYMEISPTSKSVSSYLTEKGRNVAMNIFDFESTYNLPIYDCTIKPDTQQFTQFEYTNKSIHSNIQSFGGNSMVFHQRFNHPTIAGFTLKKDNVRGAIYYVELYDDFVGPPPPGETLETDLTLKAYDMKIGADYDIDENFYITEENPRAYPLVKDEDMGGGEIGFEPHVTLEDVLVELDSNCILAHSHIVSIVTDDQRVVINGELGRNNNLLKELDNPNLELYKSEDWNTFTYTDTVLRSSDILVEGGSIDFNKSTRKLEVSGTEPFENWAIVLEGKIILASNGIKELYINFLKNREEILDFNAIEDVTPPNIARLESETGTVYTMEVTNTSYLQVELFIRFGFEGWISMGVAGGQETLTHVFADKTSPPYFVSAYARYKGQNTAVETIIVE